MKQYITSHDAERQTSLVSDIASLQHQFHRIPTLLQNLPNESTIADVWCGSEFTIVLDSEGFLWGCGWNEHGNLGIGHLDSINNICNEWKQIQKTVERNCVQLNAEPLSVHLWEGSIACGGGHVVAIMKV
jgi:alpha-tubulin suppressor-like RCC1 family protein